MFGPLNVFRSLPEASSTHSATAQQSPQGSSMKGLCAVVGIGTTAVLHSVLMRVDERGVLGAGSISDAILPSHHFWYNSSI